MTRIIVSIVILLLGAAVAGAQDPPAHDHAPAAPDGPATAAPWMFMYDGVLFATYNHQEGARGGDEFISTDWAMGMASRRAGPGQLTLTGMVSLDRATTGPRGYLELFQVGESYRLIPLIDRQHPHDLLMQASVAWRIPLTDQTGITFMGAPVGEPALGPIAYMHRASSAENPTTPLGHHTLDSTHISMGVITAAVDHGPWVFESSVFQSLEPDDNRWDLFDPGSLDSWSARVWYKPSARWEFQGSHAFLGNPERTEFAHVRRTTGSASWRAVRGNGFTAATVTVGRNDKEFHGPFHAALAEATHRRGRLAIYGRFESVEVDRMELQTRGAFHTHAAVPKDLVIAGTAGILHDLPSWRRVEIGLGSDVTFYRVPTALQDAYGTSPVSAHVFLRVRPPVGAMGRMWDMRMGRPLHQ